MQVRGVVVVVLAACRGGSPPTVATDAVAPSAAPSAATATPTAADSLATACLMVNVCSCNLGCASIRVPRSELRAGTRTKPLTTPLPGEELAIVDVVDASGEHVLALTDLYHDHACSLAPGAALLGYACRSDKSGPVPARACASGCD